VLSKCSLSTNDVWLLSCKIRSTRFNTSVAQVQFGNKLESELKSPIKVDKNLVRKILRLEITNRAVGSGDSSFAIFQLASTPSM